MLFSEMSYFCKVLRKLGLQRRNEKRKTGEPLDKRRIVTV